MRASGRNRPFLSVASAFCMHILCDSFLERALLTAVPWLAWVEPGAHSWAVLEEAGWVLRVRVARSCAGG